MTREDRDRISYKKVWLLMDAVDQEHSKNNRQWQLREIKAIIIDLKKFHYSAIVQPPHAEFHDRINKSIEDIESDHEFDFMFVDRLKDSIHSIWKDYELRFGEIEIPEESPLPDIMEQIDSAKNLKFFKLFYRYYQ